LRAAKRLPGRRRYTEAQSFAEKRKEKREKRKEKRESPTLV
jgi:hypothetical protein